MAYHYPILSLSFLLVLGVLQGNKAVQFVVNNKAESSPGAVRFTQEIGIEYTQQTMESITHFIWEMFEENNSEDRKNIETVSVEIDHYQGAEAVTYGEVITVSAEYLEGYQGNLTWEFTSLMYHEMTHVWQWNGAGRTPAGLVEGIADYTVLKAEYNPPDFAEPGMGDRWDQGYDFTARFLEYCEGIKPGFVAALNKKMRDDFSAGYFDDLLGKPVDELWSEYKGSYGGSGRRIGSGGYWVRRRGDYKAKHGN